jgi:hypothetical protein
MTLGHQNLFIVVLSILNLCSLLTMYFDAFEYVEQS